VLNEDAELMKEGRIRTNKEALRRHFADFQRPDPLKSRPSPTGLDFATA